MAKQWMKITVTTDPVLVESISDFLVGITGAGVETAVDDQGISTVVQGFIEQADLNSRQQETHIDQLRDYLANLAEIFAVPTPTVTTEFFVEEDWGTNWKKHFVPFAIIPGLVIAPTWESYDAADDELVLRMDPGMAFGTGHHATTTMALQLVRQALRESGGETLLDVGCGTGILGIAAALMGAARVVGIDNDPDAVAAATDNVVLNGVDEQMAVAETALGDITDSFPVVVANIVHDVLVALADDLVRCTRPGGRLVLSGILQGEQAENISRVFGARGCTVVQTEEQGEWCGLMLKKETR